MRLERRGNTFSGSFSSDGVNWKELGSTTIAMSSTVYVGLASLAHNNTRINVGLLDHVGVLDAAALRRLPAPKRQGATGSKDCRPELSSPAP